MSKLIWDAVETERTFEVGVKNGVLYKNIVGGGVTPSIKHVNKFPWNGLTSVSESPEGAEETALYADDMKYLSLLSAEEFGATVEAYTYPEDFNECIGIAQEEYGYYGQQSRTKFCFCYRTQLGNAADQAAGFIVHIVYNCYASASERGYETINDSPDAITFSWEVSTTKQAFAVNDVNYSASAIEFRVYKNGTASDKDGLTPAEWDVLQDILYSEVDDWAQANAYAKDDIVYHTAGSGKPYFRAKHAIAENTNWSTTDWEQLTFDPTSIEPGDILNAIISVVNT